MPKILEELQLPSLSAVIKPKEGVSLFNSGGVIKLLHADGTEQTLMTGSADGTIDLNNYYTKAEIDSMISGGTGGVGLSVEVVDERPEVGIPGVLYLVRDEDEESNSYTEYIYVNDKWELLGSTDIDLSGYALKTEIPTLTSQLVNDSGYLTEHQDISDLAKQEDVDRALTEIDNIKNNSYTKTEIDTKLEELEITGGNVDLSDYYTKQEIDDMDFAGKVRFRNWTEAE